MFSKRMLALLLTLLLAAAAPAALADTADARLASGAFTGVYLGSAPVPVASDMADFDLIAENEALRLYLNPKNLAVRALNKKTGYLWSSNLDDYSEERLNARWRGYADSGVVIEYYEFKDKMTDIKVKEESVLTSEKTVTEVTKLPNGAHVSATFGEAEITLAYDVLLTDDGFEIHMPDDAIIEETNKKLVSVTLLPFLGASKVGQQPGYFVLPDGNGALVGFKKTYQAISTAYQKRYYYPDLAFSTDPYDNGNHPGRMLSFPVYGIVHGVSSDGLMVEIAEGDLHAELLLYPAGVRTDFYFLNNRYLFRQQYTHLVSDQKKSTLITKEREHFDIRQRVTLLSGDDATYSGVARAYRARLAEAGLLPNNATGGEDIPLGIDVFVGANLEGVFSNRVQVMATLSDAGDFADDLTASGASRLHLILRHARKSNLTGKASDLYKLLPSIGDEKELRALSDRLTAAGHTLSLYFNENFVSGRIAEIDLQEDVIRKFNRQYMIYTDRYGAVSTRTYVLNSSGFQKLVAHEAKKVREMGLGSLEIFLPLPSSSFNSKSTYLRDAQMPRMAAALIAAREDTGLRYIVEQTNLHPLYLPAVDVLSRVDMGTTLLPYITDTIPFTPLILHGAIDMMADSLNHASDQEEAALRLAEWGLSPHFMITKEDPALMLYTDNWWLVSSQYDTWRPVILQTYETVNGALKGLNDVPMYDHRALAPGVVQITYENGARVVVNYTEKPYTVDAVTVPARGAEVTYP